MENSTWSDDFNRFVVSFHTRLGKNIGELLGESSRPIARFQAMAGDAVARCRNRLSEDQAQLFVANALTLWRLTAWSIVVKGAGGRQTSHSRLSRWLHGIYCARAPEIVGDVNVGKAGWIEFGQPSEELHWFWHPPLWAIWLELGLLVLSPSVFTAPSHTTQTARG